MKTEAEMRRENKRLIEALLGVIDAETIHEAVIIAYRAFHRDGPLFSKPLPDGKPYEIRK